MTFHEKDRPVPPSKNTNRLRCALAALGLTVLQAVPAQAHETWIAPLDWQIAPGEDIVADLRNGDHLVGITLPWLPPAIARTEVRDATGAREMTGRAGDQPAFRIPDTAEGLVVLGYESQPQALTYANVSKFETFVEEKDLHDVVEGAPTVAQPRELFSRHSKALVAVGNGAGEDSVLGFEIELVAERNPYTEDGPMVVRALYQDAPLAAKRVTVFARDAEGGVQTETYTTDAEGRVRFALTPDTDYLVDTVVLRRPAPEVIAEHRVLWESLWAALSFGTPPDRQ